MKSILGFLFGRHRERKGAAVGGNSSVPEFQRDLATGLRVRQYATYSDYIEHQGAKLRRKGEGIRGYDREYEAIVRDRYKEQCDLNGCSILCLAARLGGEVRAFKSLGALAIGIDIEPGPMNRDVLHGDFHEIAFPDGCFDLAFTNALDHVLNVNRFLMEVHRVLRSDGTLLIELADVAPAEFEALDIRDTAVLLDLFSKWFMIDKSIPIQNKTDFTTWHGTLYFLKKRKSLA